MNRLAGIAVSVAVLLTTAGAQAAEPQLKCQQAKLKAQGKLGLCLAKSAAAVVAGKPDLSADCRTKFATGLAKADAKAAAAGASCRFLDNGDETISDLDTGLMWEKKSTTCPGIRCYSRGWAFSQLLTSNPEGMSGNLFYTFLAGLNVNNGWLDDPSSTCFAGHCDWRVPTVEELRGIVSTEHCGSGTCIDPIFGPTHAGYYWTQTGWEGDPIFGWYLDFSDGSVAYRPSTSALAVRAVRGGL